MVQGERLVPIAWMQCLWDSCTTQSSGILTVEIVYAELGHLDFAYQLCLLWQLLSNLSIFPTEDKPRPIISTTSLELTSMGSAKRNSPQMQMACMVVRGA
jgi:hypothetical protein